MTRNIIEKIRAEIKGITETARNTRINGTTQQAKEADAIIHALDNLMLKISDLEKEEKPINPTIEKLRALIKMQIRREELNFASLGGGGQTMNIGALEWVLKQLDTPQEQPVELPITFQGDLAAPVPPTMTNPQDRLRFMEHWSNRHLQEQPISEGLEEEYLNPFKFVAGCIDDALKEKTKEVSANEIEDEINRWMGSTDCLPEDVGITPLPKVMEIVERTARHFAKWQKEQLMKEAVEGVVVSELGAVSLPRCVYEKYDGQKVKIIIVKED